MAYAVPSRGSSAPVVKVAPNTMFPLGLSAQWRRPSRRHCLRYCINCAMLCESLKTVLDASSPSRMIHTLELRPSSVYRKFGAGREGRIEREEEDGLRDFLRHPPALHRNHTDHLLPNLGGLVFTGKYFADDRRVDGTGRHRVDSNLVRNQLSSERPSE